MNHAYHLQNVLYRDILAVDDLVIPEGSFFCIVGESGGGKTTFLRLLNNMISCDRGEVRFFGRDILLLNPVTLRREAVMVPQSPFIFPGTIRVNMETALGFSGKSAAEERIEAALSGVGLGEKLDRETRTLSGGEKQRMALARALLLETRVILLDEPAASLDEDTEETVMRFLASWVAEGRRTAVVVTHSRKSAGRYGDFVLSLRAGRVAGLEERRERFG